MPTLPELLWPFADAAIMVLVVILLTRIAGLRSFSKMAGYDFVITVAMGSILASVVITRSTTFGVGIAAIVALFCVQMALSRVRRNFSSVEDAMDNEPLMIMWGQDILEDNLHAAKMTRSDLMGKLREANVLRMEQVQAVVFEQTGDVSVLHGEGPVDEALIAGVRGRP